jgi:uncharacterized protein YgiM (DUF1202 family)
MKQMTSFLLFFLLASRSVPGDAAAGERPPPFAGVITGGKVNVRAGANLNFEIIGRLERGDRVIVLGAENGWYRIEMPAAASVYVNAAYLKKEGEGIPGTYLVTGNKVNVRAGPGLNFNVLGQVGDGDRITVTGIESGEWYRIRPPEGCSSWVYRDFVEFHSSIEEYYREKREEEEIGNEYARLTGLIDRAVSARPPAPEVSALERECHRFIAGHPGRPEAKLLSGRIKELELKKAEAEYVSETRRLLETRKKLEKKIEEIERGAGEPEEPPAAVGKIEDLGKIINRPGTHKLRSRDGKIFYLKSARVNFNRYIYHSVAVWGEIVRRPEWRYPLIVVDDIRVIRP